MSDREWKFYICDMIAFAEKILAYTKGFNQKQFEADGKVYDATVRNIELMGEAAKNIPDHARLLMPTVPWRQIIATRNHLIHGYLGIDNDILWSIINNDIPPILTDLKNFRKSFA